MHEVIKVLWEVELHIRPLVELLWDFLVSSLRCIGTGVRPAVGDVYYGGDRELLHGNASIIRASRLSQCNHRRRSNLLHATKLRGPVLHRRIGH